MLENKLHQLSPYIGKLKSTIARDLLLKYSAPGDLVVDPFCGSGTVPFEAASLQRRVIAADVNPYAVMLTRAKLQHPSSVEEALDRMQQRLSEASNYDVDLRTVPSWVRRFFHPETLRDSLKFANACIAGADNFLLSCLMGILHHQRPGFLSYPSSHLVPYLRDNKYPRSRYPEMYERRELAPRLEKKVRRALCSPVAMHVARQVECVSVEALQLSPGVVDVIITSPPYMNALDYVRDNRLRMWFLDRATTNYSPEPTDKRGSFDRLMGGFVSGCVSRLRPGGLCVLVVGETVRRKRITTHPAKLIADRLAIVEPSLKLSRVVRDAIPDVRRSRNIGRATKEELVLVFEKSSARRSRVS